MKISVVVPAYNAERYLAETLFSIHKQTVKPHEVVIVNDHSTDRTGLIAQGCGKLYFYDIGFQYLEHEENLGIGATRQDGARAAKGDFVAFLSSDDVYEPNFIESSLNFLQSDFATFTDYYRCDSKLQPFEVFTAPFYSRQQEFRILAVNWALQRNMFVNFSSVIIPRPWFNQVCFMKNLRHGEDLIFLLDTLLWNYKWSHVGKPLLKYRIHSQQGTALQNFEEFRLLWAMNSNRLFELGVPKEVVEAAYKKDLQAVQKRQSGLRLPLRKVRNLLWFWKN